MRNDDSDAATGAHEDHSKSITCRHEEKCHPNAR
jgi:hypothetical protein